MIGNILWKWQYFRKGHATSDDDDDDDGPNVCVEVNFAIKLGRRLHLVMTP